MEVCVEINTRERERERESVCVCVLVSVSLIDIGKKMHLVAHEQSR